MTRRIRRPDTHFLRQRVYVYPTDLFEISTRIPCAERPRWKKQLSSYKAGKMRAGKSKYNTYVGVKRTRKGIGKYS